MKKKLNLGLFGFGCVGQGLYRILNETQGVKATVKRICIKHSNKERTLPAELFTTFGEEIFQDDAVDVVVELIDDPVAAFQILKRALHAGKAVVTANKRMLAEHLPEILELQRTHDRPVLYEGAVCGSIPIIRNLEEYYDNDTLKRVEGILNGSTNYILTRLAEGGMLFPQALKQAQELGFAESNPRLDVQAFDPAFKLSILLAHAFGVLVHPSEIIHLGIDRISEQDLKYARTHNLKIRLVAQATRCGNRVFGLVAPQFVNETHPLWAIRNELNAVIVEGAFAEEQLFVGKGAGGNPTGSAVLSDISALGYDYRYAYKKLGQSTGLKYSREAEIDVLVSFPKVAQLSPSEFIDFRGGLRSEHYQQMRGTIRLETLAQWCLREELGIILAPGAIPLELDKVKKEVLAFA